MADEKHPMLDIYLKEYEKLKAEQLARVGFRDNLLYVTLVLISTITSFTLSNKSYYTLLIIPWVCLILGWTYVVNDEKITAIGRYLRHSLTEKIQQETGQPSTESILGWEIAHRSDLHRRRRKIEQLFIDELIFVGSGMFAVFTFWILTPQISVSVQVLCVLEIIILTFLGIEIFIYADLVKGG